MSTEDVSDLSRSYSQSEPPTSAPQPQFPLLPFQQGQDPVGNWGSRRGRFNQPQLSAPSPEGRWGNGVPETPGSSQSLDTPEMGLGEWEKRGAGFGVGEGRRRTQGPDCFQSDAMDSEDATKGASGFAEVGHVPKLP